MSNKKPIKPNDLYSRLGIKKDQVQEITRDAIKTLVPTNDKIELHRRNTKKVMISKCNKYNFSYIKKVQKKVDGKIIDVLDDNGNTTFKRVHKKNVYGIKVIDKDGFPIIHEFKLYKSSYTNVEDNYNEAIITNHDVESVQDS